MWKIVLFLGIITSSQVFGDVIGGRQGTLPKSDGLALLLVEEHEMVTLHCEDPGHQGQSGSTGEISDFDQLEKTQWHFNTVANNALTRKNRQLTTNGSLLISDFDGLLDSGTYFCTVEQNQKLNDDRKTYLFGKSLVLSTRRYLSLLPVIERGPKNKIALLGDTVRFSCDVALYSDVTDDTPKVTWYRNNLPIESGGVGGSGGSSGGGGGKPHAILGSDLMLFYVDDSSVANYYCVASANNFSVASQIASLSISRLGNSFRLVPAPLIEGIEGHRVSMSCVAPEGVPEPRVWWLFEQKPIKGGENGEIKMSTHLDWDGTVRHELNISGLTIDHEGQYSCVAANPLDPNINVTSAPAWLQIKTGPRFAHQMSELMQYHSNSNLVMKCSAYASPDPPTIRFFFKGSQLHNSSRVKITETLRWHTANNRDFRLREAYLHISNISTSNDEGPYKCQALNSVNNITTLTRLEIIANPIEVTCSDNTVTTVGSDVTLECTVRNKHSGSRSPSTGGTPTTYWDTPLFGNVFPGEEKDPRLSVYSNGTLNLRNVTEQDSGTFICYVIISSQVVQKTTSLLVKALNSDPLPVIVLKPRDTEVTRGQNVTLPCETEVTSRVGGSGNYGKERTGIPVASVNAPTIKWMKDLRVVYSSEHKGIVLQKDGSLFLTNVDKQHEGTYSCVVSNGSGETIASASLVVTENYSSRSQSEGDNFYLSSKAPSSPWVLKIVNSSCLQLGWVPPPQANDMQLLYQVEKYGFGSNMWSWEVEESLASSTQYTVCGLKLNTDYVFVIRGALDKHLTGRASPISLRYSTFNYSGNANMEDVENRIGLMKQHKVVLSLTAIPVDTTSIWVYWKVKSGADIPSGFQLRCFEQASLSQPVSSGNRLELAADISLPANSRAYKFVNLQPSTKYKITIQPDVIQLYGPIADYVITETHFEVPSAPPSNIQVVQNHTLGQLTVSWDPPKGTPIRSLTGYRVTLFDPSNRAIIRSLVFDNSTEEVSITSSSGETPGERKIGVYVEAKSPAGFGPRSDAIIVDLFNSEGRNEDGFFVPIGNRNWLILTLGGSIWVCLLILIGILYFKFRKDKLTHSIQPYYVHAAMHSGSKCSGNNEQLDQDMFPASINCHQHHMTPLLIRTGVIGQGNDMQLGILPNGDVHSSQRNSLSTHYTHLPSMHNPYGAHSRDPTEFQQPLPRVPCYPIMAGSASSRHHGLFPDSSRALTISSKASPNKQGRNSAKSASGTPPLSPTEGITMQQVYNCPNGSAPGSLYAEVTDYGMYHSRHTPLYMQVPHTASQGPCSNCNQGDDNITQSNVDAADDNKNTCNCTCIRPLNNYPTHLMHTGGTAPTPNINSVIISRVHPMQHRSLVGVATNGSFFVPSTQSTSGRFAQNISGDSTSDVMNSNNNALEAKSSQTAMYYANISQNGSQPPEKLGRAPIMGTGTKDSNIPHSYNLV